MAVRSGPGCPGCSSRTAAGTGRQVLSWHARGLVGVPGGAAACAAQLTARTQRQAAVQRAPYAEFAAHFRALLEQVVAVLALQLHSAGLHEEVKALARGHAPLLGHRFTCGNHGRGCAGCTCCASHRPAVDDHPLRRRGRRAAAALRPRAACADHGCACRSAWLARPPSPTVTALPCSSSNSSSMARCMSPSPSLLPRVSLPRPPSSVVVFPDPAASHCMLFMTRRVAGPWLRACTVLASACCLLRNCLHSGGAVRAGGGRAGGRARLLACGAEQQDGHIVAFDEFADQGHNGPVVYV